MKHVFHRMAIKSDVTAVSKLYPSLRIYWHILSRVMHRVSQITLSSLESTATS